MSMTIEQTATVVAKIEQGDHRTVDAQVIREWHQMIGHNDFTDAMNAVIDHRKYETSYLVYAHVNNACKRYRNDRAESMGHEALTPPDRAKYPDISRQVDHMLTKAWNDPVLYAVAEAKLNEELAEQGFPPVHGTFRGLSPVGSGIDERPHR